jgi:EAL domain-containing protein (putative c-di-GMP-specific phosphodiesterase class I)
VGIASGHAEAESVLLNADLAMYAAKRRGAARYELFEPRMRDSSVSRRDLGAELRCAMERNELDVRYQPIVDLRGGKIVAFLAFVGRHYPARGALLAAEFAPVADETRLGLNVARWLLERAAGDLGAHGVAISLNVSMRELADQRYLDMVRSMIARGLPSSALILELSADTTIADTHDALASLDALKALGVRIALDDFRIAPTSLRELTTLPLDLLKIATPFIPSDPATARGGALLPAIVAIARGLGLETIAQGLDRPEQLHLLRDLGCALGQGRFTAQRSTRAPRTASWRRFDASSGWHVDALPGVCKPPRAKSHHP